jgi:hypothetical protein
VPAAQKSVLVSALSACADELQQRDARRFLQGLAKDELQYIAEFLGSCILESQGHFLSSRTQLVEAIKQFDRSRRATSGGSAASAVQDQEHKMILLLEYLCRSGLTRFSMGVGA